MEVLVQSQARYIRVPEKKSGENLGNFSTGIIIFIKIPEKVLEKVWEILI